MVAQGGARGAHHRDLPLLCQQGALGLALHLEHAPAGVAVPATEGGVVVASQAARDLVAYMLALDHNYAVDDAPALPVSQ